MKNILIAATILLCAFTLKGKAIAQAQTLGSTQSAANTVTTGSSIPSLTNSVTETTLFSKVIPGGLLGTNRTVYVTFLCQLSSTLINPAITIRVKYGGQTLAVASGLGINASLTSVPFYVTADITNLNSAGSQVAISRLQQSSVSTPLGSLSPIIITYGLWSVDTTIDQTLQVTAQFNSALTGTTLVPLVMKMKIE